MRLDFFNVQHVSFDIWLTLIKSNPQFKTARTRLFKRFFDLPHAVDELTLCFRKWDLRFTQINERTGKNIAAEEMLAIILSDLSYDLKQMSETALVDFFTEQEALFFQFQPELIEPQLANYLHQLREQDINLSNTGFIKGKLLRKLLHELDLTKYFSFQLFSDEIACSKPSGEAFLKLKQEAALLKKIANEHILHIGDNPYADGSGAEKLGMQSALINSNQVSLLKLQIHPYNKVH